MQMFNETQNTNIIDISKIFLIFNLEYYSEEIKSIFLLFLFFN